MKPSQLTARAAELRRRLTLDGRLTLAQPLAPAAGALALALGVALPSRWLLYIAYVFLLLLAGSYLWVRLLGVGLTLRRHLEAHWAQVGDELEERWEVENRAPLPLLWAEIDDESTLPGYNARRVVAAEAGQRYGWRTVARCERRGVYRLGPHTARLGDPLGLFQLAWREGSARELTIYPPLVRLPAATLPRGARGGLAQADLLQLNVTPNVAGVRQYVPGDPPSRVHWPYLARHGTLYVKEFDQERAGALWIVLDMAASAYPEPGQAAEPAAPAPAHTQSSVVEAVADVARPTSLVDLAVTLAASLAAQALAEGRSVGLLCDDGRRRVVPPAGGARQLWQILNALADGAAEGARPLGELLRGGLAGREGELQGAAIAVVTGDLGAAWLPALLERRLGRFGGAMALLAAARAEAAAPCEAALAAGGVPAQTFVLGTALPLASPPRRRVKARVSPLGRVSRSQP